MNQVVSNTLKKNYSAWAIFSLINNTKLNNKPVVGWRIIGGSKVTAELFIRVIRKFRNELVVRATSSEGRKTLANLVTGSDKLNLYLPEDLALLQCEIKTKDNDGDTVITIPNFMVQIDRRKHLRLLIENDIDVNISFTKVSDSQRLTSRQFKKQCYDLSAGGLSFIISKIEAKYFALGDKIQGLNLIFDNQRTMLNVEIVNILDVEPDKHNGLHYKAKKICLRYINPSINQQNVINNFVFKYVDIDQVV